MTSPLVLSYGGGVNSTALLVGMRERGIRPDLILFSDTGGEHSRTYETIRSMSIWCERELGLPITTISNAIRPADQDPAPHASLEEECHTNVTLPSLAFGNKGCSARWKRQPMDRYLRDWQPAIDAWAAGGKVTRWLGIDADEAHRSAELCSDTHKKWIYHRPLLDWDWGRDECVAACERALGSAPGKSACWFCPAMKKREVLELARTDPDLFARAVAMERNAAPNLGTVRGLGRNWSWERLVKADLAQLKLFPEAPELDCGCYDGEQE
ncbi:MAG: hypothetical protein OSB57_11435 [Planctomycetota bacterium]|nr:hypothetical protein [Planctomycetota bacterium]